MIHELCCVKFWFWFLHNVASFEIPAHAPLARYGFVSFVDHRYTRHLDHVDARYGVPRDGATRECQQKNTQILQHTNMLTKFYIISECIYSLQKLKF